jgi:hypothetical protein
VARDVKKKEKKKKKGKTREKRVLSACGVDKVLARLPQTEALGRKAYSCYYLLAVLAVFCITSWLPCLP